MIIDLLRFLLKSKGKDDFISASKMRKLLEENKWEDLKKYAPETTYGYLKKRKSKFDCIVIKFFQVKQISIDI